MMTTTQIDLALQRSGKASPVIPEDFPGIQAPTEKGACD